MLKGLAHRFGPAAGCTSPILLSVAHGCACACYRWYSGDATPGLLMASSCGTTVGDPVISVVSSRNATGGPYTCIGCAVQLALKERQPGRQAGRHGQAGYPQMQPVLLASRTAHLVPPAVPLKSSHPPSPPRTVHSLQRQRRRPPLPVQHRRQRCLWHLSALRGRHLLLPGDWQHVHREPAHPATQRVECAPPAAATKSYCATSPR